jgi:hypothetical protein
MAVLYDARGNEWTSALDQITNGTVTDARTGSAALNALNAEAVMDLNGQACATVHVISGVVTQTLVFEASNDASNWIQVPAIKVDTEAIVMGVSITTTTNAIYVVGVSGFRRLRVRVSAFTSGPVTVWMRASRADFAIYAKPFPTTTFVTATAAVNTSATATLAAPGAGLFHYITSVQLTKLYSVVGVAAGAGVIITSTNLVGNPSWTTEQIASAAGTATRVIEHDWSGNPLKSSVANTATTFVAGAQLQTIWRWNVTYYVGA